MAGELPKQSLIYNNIGATVALADAVATPMAGVRKATIMMTTTGNWTNAAICSVSADGTNYVAYNKVISNATNAITEGLIRTAGLPCSTTTAFGTLDMTNDCFAYLKITPTRVGGNATIYLLLEYY